jgi:predicted dehydrogenase
MSSDLRDKILLVGTGNMGYEYAKVLLALDVEFIAVGRSQQSAEEFHSKTGVIAVQGGLGTYLDSQDEVPLRAIVTVNVEQLGPVMMALLNKGIKRILVEKPAGLNAAEIKEIAHLAKETQAEVFVAYNRRFYTSVIKAQELIEQDGGVTSFNFEFTEWSHVLSKLNKPIEVMNQMFLANSTHVVDMAFYLGGVPDRISCYTTGELDWHPKASVFAGAGITDQGALFSYQANWESPGRWGLEVLTKHHRLIFRPLEKLMIQKIGQLDMLPVELDDELDHIYKPGLYRQVEAFIFNKGSKNLLSIEQQSNMVDKVYEQMLNPVKC